jgi:predicted RNase H-like HicB family nuclease
LISLVPIIFILDPLDRKAVERLLREAIEVHVAGLREDGLDVPEPSSVVDYVEISA